MKKYLGLDLAALQKDLSPFLSADHLRLHLQVIQGSAIAEIERNLDVSQ